MKTRLVDIQTFGGPGKQELPDDGEMVTFDRDVDHGDWKTASVRPDSWPTIKKGTRCKVVGWMQNMYGVHLRVEHKGFNYDVDAHYWSREQR